MLKVASCSCTSDLSRGKCRDSCGHGCPHWESRRLWGSRYYSFSIGRWDIVLSCRRGKLSRGIVLVYGNARPHTARQTQALLRELFHWDTFEHPPYIPDLETSNIFLFPKMKEHLAGKRFANDENLKNTVDGHIVWRGYRPYTTGAKIQVSYNVKGDYKGMYQNLYIQFL